jgi:hypothetical protein
MSARRPVLKTACVEAKCLAGALTVLVVRTIPSGRHPCAPPRRWSWTDRRLRASKTYHGEDAQ